MTELADHQCRGKSGQMKWNPETMSTERSTPEYQVAIISRSLSAISYVLPKADTEIATYCSPLCPPENSKGKGTVSRESLPGLTRKWHDGLRWQRDFPTLHLQSVCLKSLASNLVLTLSNSWSGCCCLVLKLHLTLWDPMNCSLPVSSVHGISQARILEWVAISFSRESFWPMIWTHFCICRQVLYH